MKKRLNDPSRVVREMLEGLAMLMPSVALLRDANVVVRRDLPATGARRHRRQPAHRVAVHFC